MGKSGLESEPLRDVAARQKTELASRPPVALRSSLLKAGELQRVDAATPDVKGRAKAESANTSSTRASTSNTVPLAPSKGKEEGWLGSKASSGGVSTSVLQQIPVVAAPPPAAETVDDFAGGSSSSGAESDEASCDSEDSSEWEGEEDEVLDEVGASDAGAELELERTRQRLEVACRVAQVELERRKLAQMQIQLESERAKLDKAQSEAWMARMQAEQMARDLKWTAGAPLPSVATGTGGDAKKVRIVDLL